VQDIDVDEAPFAQQDDPVGNDDGLNYYNQFIAKLHDDGGYMDPIDEPPYCGVNTCEPSAPADKAGCTKKRLFLSQEMPPVDPSTQDQIGRAPIFTPNMLRDCAADRCSCSVSPRSIRRHEKEIRIVTMLPPGTYQHMTHSCMCGPRLCSCSIGSKTMLMFNWIQDYASAIQQEAEKPKKGAKDFASQPIRFKDGPPLAKDILWDMHIPGQPMP
jgi:hypothetical protein